MLSQATYSIVDHLDVDEDDVVEVVLEEVPPSLSSQVNLFQSIMMMRSTYPPISPMLSKAT